MMHGFHYGIWWMLFNLVLWIFIVTCSVLLVLWIVGKRARGRGAPHEDSALEILNKRFARGEINKEQYDEMKKIMSEE